MAMRPSSRISRNWAKPRPCVAEQVVLAARGTRRTSGRGCRTRASPSCGTAAGPRSPACPAGTTIVEISPGPVSAVTVTIDVIGVPELVMNAFSPSITHSPARLVEAGPGARPAGVAAGVGLGQPERRRALRPAHRSGSQRSCCSGVPNLWIGLAPRPTPASSVMAIDWSTRASSSIATHSPVRSPPPPLRLGERDAEQARARPSPARCRPGTCGRGPTPRRAARSRRRRTRARRPAAPRARRSAPGASASCAVDQAARPVSRRDATGRRARRAALGRLPPEPAQRNEQRRARPTRRRRRAGPTRTPGASTAG